MDVKTGVFICDCGNNISEIIDTQALSVAARSIPGVVESKIHRLWCSEEGREELKRAIKEKDISRVIIAACSPKQHELTFQNLLAQAGLNPFLLQVVNIREQIAWVTKDKVSATQKAIAQLYAAIKRVQLHEPLEKSQIECKTDFLVIGAGVAGMTAALTLAQQKSRKVYLVEKEAWIGGKTVAYEEVFPNMECAPCMLEPAMDSVMHHERIVLLTNSTVENITGFFGNFTVQIKQKARGIDAEKCIGCGECFEVCPVSVQNKFNGNLSLRHAIYTPFAGALPNLPAIDHQNCLRSKGQDCRKCRQACSFGAVDYEQQDRSFSVEVAAIVVATGFELLDKAILKNIAADNPDIVDAFQFERLMSSTGPTAGKILTASGNNPRSIAFVHCSGGRDKNYQEYCSGVCCAYSLKLAYLAKKKLPDVKIYEIYSDWCFPGKEYPSFCKKVFGAGAEYIRVNNTNEVAIYPQGNALAVRNGDSTFTVDMCVLATAMVCPPDAARFASVLGISVDTYGFYTALHDKLGPSSANLRGIYIAGCAAGPKDITQSVLHAQAAAAMALSLIVPGEKLDLEVFTSTVDEKRCGGCRSCISLCPFQAIKFDQEKRVAVINEVLCLGCGVCTAACPAGAIRSKHFTDEQIFGEIEGLLS
ncbi:MAG: CoB--CoM heterodisulfide reductase iron-sulfur subunit A family protein [Candidatus Omnitrophota bacterium]